MICSCCLATGGLEIAVVASDPKPGDDALLCVDSKRSSYRIVLAQEFLLLLSVLFYDIKKYQQSC
jgi:hypothetical protein